jgi:hypothetical protein
VEATVPKEHTKLGSEFKFPSGIGSQVRPANAPKGSEKSIIRLGV